MQLWKKPRTQATKAWVTFRVELFGMHHDYKVRGGTLQNSGKKHPKLGFEMPMAIYGFRCSSSCDHGQGLSQFASPVTNAVQCQLPNLFHQIIDCPRVREDGVENFNRQSADTWNLTSVHEARGRKFPTRSKLVRDFPIIWVTSKGHFYPTGTRNLSDIWRRNTISLFLIMTHKTCTDTIFSWFLNSRIDRG